MGEKGHINFDTIDSAFVTGAGSGIGLAFVSHLLHRNNRIQVFASYREKARATSLFELKEQKGGSRLHLLQLSASLEDDYKNATEVIGKSIKQLDLVLNCIGYLHGDVGKPEKRLSEIDMTHLIKSFEANSFPVVMLAKYLLPLLKNSSPSIFASLSARVGSIGDNRSGGWYSYRASKSAHNMLLKNVSLELERFRCNTLTLALHPGTTKTKLSEPFIARTKYTLHSARETAENLINVMSQNNLDVSGSFLDWEGKPIEW